MIKTKHIQALSFLFLWLLGTIAFAQTPTITQTSDTTTQDTVKKKVKPNAKWVLPHRAYYHDSPNVKIIRDFRKQMYWNEIDTLQGFVHHLGVLGKPYQQSLYGFSDKFYQMSYWKNPMYNTYNIHLINPLTEVKYYDTKTAYVNLDFCQGPQRTGTKDITISGVTASVNITPFWNVTGYIKRRQAQSIYGSSTTDTRNIYASSYFHTWKYKYQLFTNFVYNDINNELNGGVNFTKNSDFANAFAIGQYTNLSAAQAKVMTKAYTVDQFYNIFASKDSSKIRQELTIRNTLLFENVFQKNIVPNITQSYLQTNIVPNAPTLFETVDTLKEAYVSNQYYAFGGLSYRFITPIFLLSVDGGLGYQRFSINKEGNKVRQNNYEQKATAKLEIPKINFVYQFQFLTKPNNLFNPELSMRHHADWLLPIPYVKLKNDSLSRYQRMAAQPHQKPLFLSFEYLINSQNPSIFQTYYTPTAYNTFVPNPNLKNQQINHIHAKIAYASRNIVFKKDTLLANTAYLQPFISVGTNLIYYGTQMQVLQAPQGQSLTWLGAEVGARWRLWRRWYLQPKVVYQKGITASNADAYLQKYADNQPFIYTQTSFYHESSQPSFKGKIRYGVDVYFHSWFRAMSLDAVSSEFFATDYFTKGYIRADLFFTMQIKRANFFVRMTNTNAQLGLPGYFMTGTYPGLGRTLNFGINWSFFD